MDCTLVVHAGRTEVEDARKQERKEPGRSPPEISSPEETHSTPGTVHLPSTWLPELLRPGKGTKYTPNLVYALVEYPRT